MSSSEANIRLACADRLQSRRRSVLLMFVLALLLLIVAVGVFVAMHQRDLRAGLELDRARQASIDARHQEDVARQQSRLRDVLQQLDKRARSLGLAPQQWSERKINLHQQSIPRVAANDILVSTGRGNGRLFASDAFDLSVTRSSESLFEVPADNNQPLRMTMSGTALFGTRGIH
ncbi:MAG: hypothetical protein WCD66_03055 [Rhodanobacteraceae bacterium]